MQKVNLDTIPEFEWKSPTGKFHQFSKEVSIALGRDPASPDLQKRHPFDLELTRLPPRALNCPYHSHSAQWELYLIVSGRGQVRHAAGTTEVTAGDAFLFPPGEPHQISNPGDDDLLFYVIADNPIGESCHYPDSDKWLVSKDAKRVLIQGEEVDYLDGEE